MASLEKVHTTSQTKMQQEKKNRYSHAEHIPTSNGTLYNLKKVVEGY